MTPTGADRSVSWPVRAIALPYPRGRRERESSCSKPQEKPIPPKRNRLFCLDVVLMSDERVRTPAAIQAGAMISCVDPAPLSLLQQRNTRGCVGASGRHTDLPFECGSTITRTCPDYSRYSMEGTHIITIGGGGRDPKGMSQMAQPHCCPTMLCKFIMCFRWATMSPRLKLTRFTLPGSDGRLGRRCVRHKSAKSRQQRENQSEESGVGVLWGLWPDHGTAVPRPMSAPGIWRFLRRISGFALYRQVAQKPTGIPRLQAFTMFWLLVLLL